MCCKYFQTSADESSAIFEDELEDHAELSKCKKAQNESATEQKHTTDHKSRTHPTTECVRPQCHLQQQNHTPTQCTLDEIATELNCQRWIRAPKHEQSHKLTWMHTYASAAHRTRARHFLFSRHCSAHQVLCPAQTAHMSAYAIVPQMRHWTNYQDKRSTLVTAISKFHKFRIDYCNH